MKIIAREEPMFLDIISMGGVLFMGLSVCVTGIKTIKTLRKSKHLGKCELRRDRKKENQKGG